MPTVLVDSQRVADESANVDMVDVENRELFKPGLANGSDKFFRNFLAGFAVNFAGLDVDQVFGKVSAEDILVRYQELLGAFRRDLVGQAGCHLASGLDHDLAGLGVNEIARGLHAAEALRLERHLPTLLVRLQDQRVVESRKNFLVIQSERIEKCRGREFAAAVDAHVNQILGVELEIEPGAAVGNDAGSKQEFARRMGLAAIMIKEDAR